MNTERDKPLTHTIERECPECKGVPSWGDHYPCHKCHGSGILTTTYQFVVEKKCKDCEFTYNHCPHKTGTVIPCDDFVITHPATVEDLVQMAGSLIEGTGYRTGDGALAEIRYKAKDGSICTLKLVEVREGK